MMRIGFAMMPPYRIMILCQQTANPPLCAYQMALLSSTFALFGVIVNKSTTVQGASGPVRWRHARSPLVSEHGGPCGLSPPCRPTATTDVCRHVYLPNLSARAPVVHGCHADSRPSYDYQSVAYGQRLSSTLSNHAA